MRVKPKRSTKSTRTTTKLKRRENVIPGRKSRAELMGVREVEVVQSEKLHCISRLQAIASKAIKENGLTEEQVRKTLGVKRYEK